MITYTYNNKNTIIISDRCYFKWPNHLSDEGGIYQSLNSIYLHLRELNMLDNIEDGEYGFLFNFNATKHKRIKDHLVKLHFNKQVIDMVFTTDGLFCEVCGARTLSQRMISYRSKDSQVTSHCECMECSTLKNETVCSIKQIRKVFGIEIAVQYRNLLIRQEL